MLNAIEVALRIRKELKPFVFDPQKHVKIWISKDGLPPKHQARFIKFKALNPKATVRLIYVDKYLTDDARIKLKAFAKKLSIILVDYSAIKPCNDYEIKIKAWLDHEIEYFFNQSSLHYKGNLSVVADQLRLFEQVISYGILSDCDVEFDNSLPTKLLIAPLGFIARQKNQGTRISNDLTTGASKHPVFETARRLVCQFNAFYHAAVPNYFKSHHIEFDPENYKQHPKYYEARNLQLKQFSLGGGPQLFAIALNQCGIATGYENTSTEIFELRKNENLNFSPYQFLAVIENQQQISNDFKQLFPSALGYVKSHWDTSWMPGQDNWKILTPAEEIRLALFEKGFHPSRKLLWLEQILLHVPRPKLSNLVNYFSYFFQPLILGKRHKEYDDLPPEVQAYIQRNETPNALIQTELSVKLGANFTYIAEKLKTDGVVVLPNFIANEKLKLLQAAYEREINKKDTHPILKQISFNLAADRNYDPELLPAALSVGNDPALQALVRYHLGYQKLIAMRGYRQEPVEPVRLRAWDYHQDIKSQGPHGEIKIMILLNGVKINGQAMQFMLGSHKYHWNSTSLAQSKYTIDEALFYADNGVKICYGSPGSIVIFDTNGIHSGQRNFTERRDVITMSYAPANPDCADMFDVPASANLDKAVYKFSPTFWQAVKIDEEKLTAEEISRLKKQYKKCPSLANFKDRYSQTSCLSLADFIVKVASQDMNGDLDLPLRVLTTHDKDRDNQMVEFRDASPTHKQFHRLHARIKQKHPDVAYNIDIQALTSYATIAGNLTHHPVIKISSCAKFSSDIAEAFSRLDSIQRLRSMMIYLYFTLDRIQEELKVSDIKQANYFDQMAVHVLDMYTSAVFLDDLNEELTKQTTRKMYYR